jgi:hypothetical protein
MIDRQRDAVQLTPRESYLMVLLKKVLTEYKALVQATRRVKPLKIVDIIELSAIPGETKFAVQITNKNAIVKLKAEEIILSDFELDQFNDFHAEMIRQALCGKLAEYLKMPVQDPPSTKFYPRNVGNEIKKLFLSLEKPKVMASSFR